MIDRGVWRARAVGAALGKTSKGSEQVAVELEVINNDGTPGPRITWFGYFSEKTVDRTIESLRLLGWQGDDLSDLAGVSNNDVSIVVEHEEYEGKVQARVRWINAPGGIALQNAMDETDAKSFAARMRSAVRAYDAAKSGPRTNGKPAPKPRTTRQPEPPPPTDADAPPDDKLPF